MTRLSSVNAFVVVDTSDNYKWRMITFCFNIVHVIGVETDSYGSTCAYL